MTWVRLKRSHIDENRKKWPIGRLLNYDTPTARGLVEKGIAELYDGPRPPQTKMKTDLFKPKL